MPKTEIASDAAIAAVACGTCGDVRGSSMVPDGCKACRVAFVGDAPRAVVRVGVVVASVGLGARVGAGHAVDFIGAWTLEERVRLDATLRAELGEATQRVEAPLRLIHGGKCRA